MTSPSDINPTTTEAFENGVQAFNNGKDILDLPITEDAVEIDQWKDGWYFALDQSVLADSGITSFDTSDDHEWEQSDDDSIPVGQEVFDELFEDISSFEKEDDQVALS